MVLKTIIDLMIAVDFSRVSCYYYDKEGYNMDNKTQVVNNKATPRNRPLKQGTPQNRYASPRSCSQGALYQASKFFLSAR